MNQNREMTKHVMLALAVAGSLSLPVDVGARPPQEKAALDGKEVFLNRCSTCHGPDRALAASRTKTGWEAILAEMVNNGAQLEDGESEVIVGFLTAEHGLVNVNAATAEELVALALPKQDADAIVSHRTAHGPFADFAALRAVPGLDLERVDAVRERVAFRD